LGIGELRRALRLAQGQVQVVVLPVAGVLAGIGLLHMLQDLAEGRRRAASREQTQPDHDRERGQAHAGHYGVTRIMAIMPRSSWDRMWQ
jgi:hypothetical protein